MKTNSRIRWTEEESSAVIEAAKELNAKSAKLSSGQRLSKAQSVLPKARRRPFSANLSSWLNKAARGETLAVSKGKPARATTALSESAFANPKSSDTTQVLIAAGVAIFKQILSDKGVQKALKAALR